MSAAKLFYACRFVNKVWEWVHPDAVWSFRPDAARCVASTTAVLWAFEDMSFIHA